MVNTPLITAQSPRVFTESYVTVWLTTESQCVGIKCSDFYREVIYLGFLGGNSTCPIGKVQPTVIWISEIRYLYPSPWCDWIIYQMEHNQQQGGGGVKTKGNMWNMENKIISILKGFNDHQISKSFQCCWLWRRMWTLKCMQNGNELRINILFASNKNTAFPSTSLQKILRNRSPANFHQALCIIQYSNFINRWKIKLEALNLLHNTPSLQTHNSGYTRYSTI